MKSARRLAALGRIALLVPFLLATACRGSEPARSLIIICIDTLRSDHVHSYGYDRATTPTIDALAGEGARFDRAFSTSNWTVPAVASVFTSVSPSRHGAGIPGEQKNLDQDSPTPIASELTSLADVVKARGFRTGLFSANPFLYGSFQNSFDTVRVERIPGEQLADAAIDWISEQPEEPSFLYLHFMDVHQPNLPPAPYFDFFATPGAGNRERRHSNWSFGALRDSTDPDFVAFRENRVAVYDGSIRYVDAQIHRLLERAKSLGILGRAAVVIYSDHGEEFWDHAAEEALLQDDPRGIWGIGHGHSMYQELLRVPLVISYGSHLESAAIDCPVSLLDVAPTALALLGLEAPPTMEGRSLVRLLRGDEPCPRRALVAESPAYGPDSAALVAWPMKLVIRGAATRLYALDRDPFERTDLSASAPLEARAMRSILEKSLSDRIATADPPVIDPDLLEQLRSLGYLDP